MRTSESKALIAGFAIVSCAMAGAWAWLRAHPDVSVKSELARLSPIGVAPPSASPPGAGPRAAGDAPRTDGARPAEKPKMPLAAPVPAENAAAAKEKPGVAALTSDQGPRFDVVRVEPNGETVVAGIASPNARVELLAAGQPIGEARADDTGHFVILPQPLPPGPHDLTLRQTAEGGPPSISRQGAAVSIPQKGTGARVTVALGEAPPPSPPSRSVPSPTPSPPVSAVSPPAPVAPPPQVAATAPRPPDTPDPGATALVLHPVEVRGGGFFASGSAAPGTHVQIDLNGTRLAEVVAGADGAWSLTLKKGLTSGQYAVRARAVGTDGRLQAQASAPFEVPNVLASAPPVPAAPSPAAPSPAERSPAMPVPAPSVSTVSGSEPAPRKSVPPDQGTPAGGGAPAAAPAPVAEGPEPPSAPDPSEVPGLGPPPPETAPVVADAKPPEPIPGLPPSTKAREEARTDASPARIASVPRASPAVPEKPASPGPRPDPAIARPRDVPASPVAKNVPETGTASSPRADSASNSPASAADVTTFAPAVSTLAPATRQPDRQAAANAIIDEVSTTLVVPGDNLWNISRSRLGLGRRFVQIYVANQAQIRDPKLIYPGQVFVVPPK